MHIKTERDRMEQYVRIAKMLENRNCYTIIEINKMKKETMSYTFNYYFILHSKKKKSYQKST